MPLEIKYRLEHYYDEPSLWVDLFEPSREHIGGVTVQYRGKHFKPTQYSLSELASEYAKQGRPNPSKEAYDSVLQELKYLDGAYSVGLWVKVSVGDTVLIDEHIIGSDFNPEYDDEEETLKRLVDDYGSGEPYSERALAELRERLSELNIALSELVESVENEPELE